MMNQRGSALLAAVVSCAQDQIGLTLWPRKGVGYWVPPLTYGDWVLSGGQTRWRYRKIFDTNLTPNSRPSGGYIGCFVTPKFLRTSVKGLRTIAGHRTVRLAFAMMIKPALMSCLIAAASFVAPCPLRANDPQVVSIPNEGVRNVS